MAGVFTEQMTQALAIIDSLNSQTVNNASVNSPQGIDMSKVKRAFYIIAASSLGAAGTLDGRLQSSASATFASGVHNLTGTNLTQLTTASVPNNNAILTIEVRSDQVVNQNSGDRYVRLNLTGGGNAITVQALGLGCESMQGPANQYNANNTYLGQQVISNQ